MTLKAISHTDSLLEQVVALGKKNAKTLGMFPEGAFIDHAKRKNIIVAVENDQLLGYILFRVTQSKRIVSIAHLCIETEHRNKGIAKQLLDSVKEQYKNLFNGIALSCRKDYVEASKFYEKNGFKAIKEVRSRSKEENYLVKWYYHFGNADLFSDTHFSQSRINVLLDASILIKLRDEPDAQSAEAHSLNADWLVEETEFFYAPEMFNEINRDTDRARATSTRTFLTNFKEAQFVPEERNKVLSELSEILNGTTENDISDKNQLAECIASGLNYFVTTDEGLLELNEEIFNKFSIRVLRPTELILFIDQLKNKSDYNSFRVAGANYEYKKLEQQEVTEIIEIFLQKDAEEKKHELRTIFMNVASDVKNTLIRIVKDGQKNYLGFFAAQADNDSLLKVSMIRTAKSKIADVLFYQMINDIINVATDKNIQSIKITEQYLTDEMIEILISYGFEKRNDEWQKVALKGLTNFDAILDANGAVSEHLDIENLRAKYEAINNQEKELLKLEIERKLWPLKIADVGIPTYIIPIKPYWASQLFDHHQANHTLFGSKPELSWHRENIYYRNVKPVSEKVPARILWYISSETNNPIGRQKGIVACSYLDEVHTGPAKNLYQKFKNFGVYEWKDIFKSTEQDAYKEMKALKFSDTEVFKNPIPFETVSEVLQRNGKPQNTFASPVEVSKEIFNELYKIGKEFKGE